MKVIGTGAPVMLTLRLAPREVDGLREELIDRRAARTEAASVAGACVAHGGGQRAESDLEGVHLELVEISNVLSQLDRAEPNATGRIEVVGPTELLGPAIRSAAGTAGRQLHEAMERFLDRERHCTPQQLRDAVANAAAWSESLLAYDYVDNHALLPGA